MAIKIDQKYLVIGLIVLTILILYISNKSVSQDLRNAKKLNEHIDDGENNPKIINYNASWCGHSKNLEPVWDKVTEYYKSKPVDIVNFKCDASKENRQYCVNEKIKGFPTIMGIVGENTYMYPNVPRSFENICSWIDKVCGFE